MEKKEKLFLKPAAWRKGLFQRRKKQPLRQKTNGTHKTTRGRGESPSTKLREDTLGNTPSLFQGNDFVKKKKKAMNQKARTCVVY